MKIKTFLIFISMLVIIFSFTACSSSQELTSDNVKNLLAISVEYGDISYVENNSISHNEKYYLSCKATITVFAKRDIRFKDAICNWVLDDLGKWQMTKQKGHFDGGDLIYDAHGSIQIDKDGNGRCVVELFCYADTLTKVSPYTENYNLYFSYASGEFSELQ